MAIINQGHEEEVSSHRHSEREQIKREEPADVGQRVTVSSLFGVYTPQATTNCRERKWRLPLQSR